MFALAPEDFIVLLILWLISASVQAFVFVRFVFTRYAAKALIKAFEDPDEALSRAILGLFSGLWAAANAPSVEVGKDEEGKAILVSPIQLVTRAMANSAVNQLRGVKGKVAAVAQGAIEDLGLIDAPRKGESTGEYLIRTLAPMIRDQIEKKFKTLGDQSTSSGSAARGTAYWETKQ
jgi:hypothetical protein